jgi:hypothetical protein
VSFNKIYEKLQKCVVKVIATGTTRESGTGFILTSEGHVLTCYHVIANASNVQISLGTSLITVNAVVVGFDAKNDIAILKAEVNFPDFLAIGESRDAKPGDKVIALGYPLVGERQTEDTPSAFDTFLANVTPHYLKLKGVAGIGASGSPLYSIDQGGVIGVIARELTSITIDFENYATGDATFAIPVHRFNELLRETVRTYKIVTSTQQIDEFKRRVVQIYNAQGFTTQTDVPIGAGEKLDICANISIGGSSLNFGIQCLYKDGLIDADEIRKFHTTFALTNSSTISINKYVIVSNSNFTVDAREIALRSDMDLVRFQDLSTKAVNFTSYLQQLIDNFESLDYKHFLVESPYTTTEENTEGITISSVFEYVRNSVLRETSTNIALLGNFGMGKTVFCRRLAAYLAQKHLEDPIRNKIPIYVDLKIHKAGTRIEETIISSLQLRYGVNWDVNTFSFLRQTGQLIFILDGLDEMAAKVDRAVINENIRETTDLAETGKNSLILTCRTHFFRSSVDESKLTNFRFLYLLPWGKQELIAYLGKRLPQGHASVLEKIETIFNLEELAQTPIFLDMIVATLESIVASEKAINPSSLYDYYTQQWISTQEVRRGSVLSGEQKEKLMGILAYEMLMRDELKITYEELNEIIKFRLNMGEDRLEEASNDIRTCSFLVREGDAYRFSHTSFVEFFVAKKYLKEIKDNVVVDFGKVYFKQEIFQFLLGLLNSAEDEGVGLIKRFVKSCPVSRSRARIHSVFLLADIGTTKAEEVLWDILENDPHSRVSGHAAEALYRKYKRDQAFDKLFDTLRKQPYSREITLPDEPNIGWYTVEGNRTFSVHDPEIITFFVNSISQPLNNDVNTKWYATSVLSRITNIKETISKSAVEILTQILRNDDLPRVRAYAATILGNLGISDAWITDALHSAQKLDNDDSVKKACETALRKLTKKENEVAN